MLFFRKYIWKWSFELLRDGWQLIRRYFDRLIRIVTRLGRIAVLPAPSG